MSKDYHVATKLLEYISKEFINNPDESAKSFVLKVTAFIKSLTPEERDYFIDFCHLCGGKMSCKVNWE